MIKIKKINFNYLASVLILSLVGLTLALIIAIIFALSSFNSIRGLKTLIDEKIDRFPLEKIKTAEADKILNYLPENVIIDHDKINNPFKVFANDEEGVEPSE